MISTDIRTVWLWFEHICAYVSKQPHNWHYTNITFSQITSELREKLKSVMRNQQNCSSFVRKFCRHWVCLHARWYPGLILNIFGILHNFVTEFLKCDLNNIQVSDHLPAGVSPSQLLFSTPTKKIFWNQKEVFASCSFLVTPGWTSKFLKPE